MVVIFSSGRMHGIRPYFFAGSKFLKRILFRYLFKFFIPQHPTQHFADERCRQGFPELNGARPFVPGQLLFAKVDDFLFFGGFAGSQLNKGGLPARGSGIQTRLLAVRQAICIAMLQPKLWYMGSTRRKQCAPPLFSRSGAAPVSWGIHIQWSRAVTLKTMFAWVRAAPLGTPGVPPV
jgi:hypothetical protein